MFFSHNGKTRLKIVFGLFRFVEAHRNSLFLHLLGGLQGGVDLTSTLRQEAQAAGELGECVTDSREPLLAIQVPGSELIVVNGSITIGI